MNDQNAALDPVAAAVEETADDLLSGLDLTGDEPATPAEASATTEETPEAESATTAEEPETPAATTEAESAPAAAAPATPTEEANPVAEVPSTPIKAPEPTPDPHLQAFQTRLAKYTADRAALKAKIDGNTFDPIDDAREKARLDMEREELLDAKADLDARAQAARQQQEEQAKAVQGAWDAWGEAHKDIGGKEWGAKILEAAYAKALPRYGHAGAVAVANEKLNDEVAKARAALKPATPKPVSNNQPNAKATTTATPPKARTQVTPAAGAAAARPKPVPADPGEEFDRKFAGSLGDAWG